MTDAVTIRQFQESEGVSDWRILGDGASVYYPVSSLTEQARFVHAISELPGIEDHRPDIDLRADGVTLRLVTVSESHSGMSQSDIEVARQVSELAHKSGFAADPSKVQSVLVIPGGPSVAAIMPFWQAVLGYERRPDSPEEDLVDPRNRTAAFWFEQMKEARADGGGAVHIAVWVPADQAEARIAAALAAGGRIVRDEFAPAWWTLADAAGNEADISTAASRD